MYWDDFEITKREVLARHRDYSNAAHRRTWDIR